MKQYVIDIESKTMTKNEMICTKFITVVTSWGCWGVRIQGCNSLVVGLFPKLEGRYVDAYYMNL